MQIAEDRLKEIVLEEVHNRLVERQWQQFKTAMREELAKEGIYLTEEELEEVMSDKWKRRMGALALGGTLATGIGGVGTLAQQVGQRGEETHQVMQQAGEERAQAQATEEYKVENMRKHLDNTAKWQWDWNEEPEERAEGSVAPPPLPLVMDQDQGTIGVLSPEFGVFKIAYDDYSSGEGPRYLPDDIVEATGDAQENRVNFPDETGLERTPDYEAGGSPGQLQQAHSQGFESYGSGGGAYDGVIYMSADNIPDDYRLPNADMSKSEYYNQIWQSFVEGGGELPPGAETTAGGGAPDPGAYSWYDPETMGDILQRESLEKENA